MTKKGVKKMKLKKYEDGTEKLYGTGKDKLIGRPASSPKEVGLIQPTEDAEVIKQGVAGGTISRLNPNSEAGKAELARRNAALLTMQKANTADKRTGTVGKLMSDARSAKAANLKAGTGDKNKGKSDAFINAHEEVNKKNKERDDLNTDRTRVDVPVRKKGAKKMKLYKKGGKSC